MKKNRLFVFLTACLAFIFTGTVKPQVKNSIYSMFGVGQLFDNSIGINKSLGGTGIAFQSGRSINYLNPASYLGIFPNSFVMEAGVYGIYNKSKNDNSSQTANDVKFSYFSAGLSFTNWWAFSVGMVPFSSVDYEINSTDEINGTLTSFEKNFTGSGGLNRLYLGNSFRLLEGLSAGFNLSYIVGPISQTETAVDNDNFSGYEFTNKRTVYGLYLDYGLQYSLKNEDWFYTMGLVYGAGKKLNSKDELEFTYNGTTTTLDEQQEQGAKIPKKIGFGIAAKKGNNFRAGFDYEWADWSSVNFSNPNIDTKNSNRFSIGVEYCPRQHQSDSWLNTLYYRFGANYKSSYLKIDNTQIKSMAVNFGIGIPYDNASIINLSVEYGEGGTLSKGLIKDSSWTYYLSFSLYEFWSRISARN